jgi:hypothetical protein
MFLTVVLIRISIRQFQQQRLFTEMNDAVRSFTKDLKENGRFDDVLGNDVL